MIGEEAYFLSGKDQWQIGTVVGTRDVRRSFDILTGEETSLRRNRFHHKPRSFDIPIISQYFASRTSTSSQSEISKTSISGLQHPPKVKYSHNTFLFRTKTSKHPPKVKYFPKTVPKLVIRCVGDTAYDSYISEILYPLKRAIKHKKQTRFAGDPVTSVKTILARRKRSHPPKWTINAGDPDLLIPIVVTSQGRNELKPRPRR